MSEQLPALTFVIPVRNDAERLDRCLRSIRSNQYPSGLITIVVADNGSTDDSQAVALSHRARVLFLPALRLGALRNAAASAAEGEVLAFVDADHEIDPGWASAAADLLTDPAVGGAGAAPEPPEPGTWVQRAYDRLRSHPSGTRMVDWLGSGNLAVRLALFQEVGGFDPALETCEDVDLCRRLRARGAVLVADGRLRSIHYGDPETIRQVFLGELWRGRDNIRVSLRPPRSWRMLASALLPAATLAGLAGLILGLVIPRGGWPIVLAAATLVLALVGLRMLLMWQRGGLHGPTAPQIFQVAAAYEFGRALAILGRFGHGHRRATTKAKRPVSDAGGPPG